MKRIGIDISVLNSPQKTGIAVYAYELIKALLEINKKDQFKLFGVSTFETYDYLKNIEFKNYPNTIVVVQRLPSKLFRSIFLAWQKMEWPPIENLVGKVDIYHSINWYFPPQKDGKKVATVFDMTPFLFPQFHHKRTVELEKIRLGRINKMADLVITISENSKKDFLKFYPESEVEVIYPASDRFSVKFTNKEVDGALKKYKLQRGYFLSVSTLEPRKNLAGLINAYLEGNFKYPLVMVGIEGWKSNEISKLIKSSQNIIPLDYIPDEDLPPIYKGARFLVYPSYYEGFGLPVLEAMSLGVPVICSNASSLREVSGDATYYIDPNNLSDLIEAMQKMDSNEKLRSKLITRGFKQARKFSWKKSALKLNSLYQNL